MADSSDASNTIYMCSPLTSLWLQLLCSKVQTSRPPLNWQQDFALALLSLLHCHGNRTTDLQLLGHNE